MAAATTVNVPCGLVNFHKDSETVQAGPGSVATGKRRDDRRGTWSTTITKKASDRPALVIEKNSDRQGTWSPAIRSDREGAGKKNNGWKVDEWMEESVAEIVKNLREAPLLVQVYEGGERRTLRGVEEECWGEAIEKWKRREAPMPEGVIFVEQLEEEEEEKGRVWGVVVQGRGGEWGPVCYLLKTSRGGGGGGLGLCCTHFCLMRVKNFRESAERQLKSCWLA